MRDYSDTKLPDDVTKGDNEKPHGIASKNENEAIDCFNETSANTKCVGIVKVKGTEVQCDGTCVVHIMLDCSTTEIPNEVTKGDGEKTHVTTSNVEINGEMLYDSMSIFETQPVDYDAETSTDMKCVVENDNVTNEILIERTGAVDIVLDYSNI